MADGFDNNNEFYGSQPSGPKRSWQEKIVAIVKKLKPWQWAVVGCVAVVIIGGGIMVLAFHHSAVPDENKPVVAAKKQKPKTTVPSNLTGLPVPKGSNDQPVTAVMIENTIFARPQSGLSQAGVVFEAIAEAGITRFVALYQQANPKNLGPIRSARPYFMSWLMGFNATYAHAGGSPEALRDIKKWHVKNIGFFAAPTYYHRISQRAAPHNLYTSMSSLSGLEKKFHFNKAYKFTPFPRKKDNPSKSPAAATIKINPSSPTYADYYTYDKKHNDYQRNLAGKPHKDANTGKQITPKVVIAIVVPYGHESDGYHSYYKTIGHGAAYIFQDGTVTKGVWKKPARDKQILFYTKKGKSIKLDAGQTWITAVNSASRVAYKPAPKPKPTEQ
jgi:hypothetical protein